MTALQAGSVVTERLKADAEAVWRAGLSAVSPRDMVFNVCRREGDVLTIHSPDHEPVEASFDLKYNVKVVAFGKAVLGMVNAIEDLLGDHIVAGIASVPVGYTATASSPAHPIVEIREGAKDNMPDKAAVETAELVLKLCSEATKDDIVLFLVSGGGSALLPLPDGDITLDDKVRTIKELANHGATIHELNTVRQHISRVKGGKLANIALPAKVVTLAISDVIGDSLELIASGPTVPCSTTPANALAIIKRFGMSDIIPKPVMAHLTTGQSNLEKAHAVPNSGVLIGTNAIALQAAERKAIAMGYSVLNLGAEMDGDARELGKLLAAKAQSYGCLEGRHCILCGGETTVTVLGDGIGGRNQELAVAFGMQVEGKDGIVILSAGTDGQDGPTPAAGGFGHGQLVAKAKGKQLDPTAILERNDSYSMLAAIGEDFKTGLTGTNVMDIQVVLVDIAAPRQGHEEEPAPLQKAPIIIKVVPPDKPLPRDPRVWLTMPLSEKTKREAELVVASKGADVPHASFRVLKTPGREAYCRAARLFDSKSWWSLHRDELIEKLTALATFGGAWAKGVITSFPSPFPLGDELMFHAEEWGWYAKN